MAATKITVNNNGSIRVEGDFEIVDPAGQHSAWQAAPRSASAAAAHSANKPFCDGSHKAIDFPDPVVARDLPPPPEAASLGAQAAPRSDIAWACARRITGTVSAFGDHSEDARNRFSRLRRR